jgi:alkyl hydroperoxide reductase subunit AhpC
MVQGRGYYSVQYLNLTHMSLRLGDKAPNFKAKTSKGEIDFYEFLGDSWGVLFSHPADYTPVCTTELGRTAALKDEFEKRNVKVAALSVDSVESHYGWINDINETQDVEVNFPIIGDESREIAEAYDMIHPNASATATVRSLFVIAPDKTIKLIISYPASTGRNFQEILRVIDSLQLTANYSVATPADWKQGDDVVITPAVKDEDVPAKFPKGHTVIKPYLRMTPQPNK